jgi:hypothetical protein
MHEKELWVKFAIYKDCTEMLHGQQNMKQRMYKCIIFSTTGIKKCLQLA